MLIYLLYFYLLISKYPITKSLVIVVREDLHLSFRPDFYPSMFCSRQNPFDPGGLTTPGIRFVHHQKCYPFQCQSVMSSSFVWSCLYLVDYVVCRIKCWILNVLFSWILTKVTTQFSYFNILNISFLFCSSKIFRWFVFMIFIFDISHFIF